MSDPFRHSFRVRYAEVDPQSVVFNSRYLEYADVVVTEFFIDLRAQGKAIDSEFHVRHAEIDYLAPIRLEEMIEGRLTIERIGNSSLEKKITLHGAEDGSLRATISLVTVHVDLSTGQSMPIPDHIREAFGFPALEKAHG